MDTPNQKNNQNNQSQTTKPMPFKPAPQPAPKTAPVKNTPPAAPASSPVMQVTAAFVVGILVGVIGYTLANRHFSVVNTNEAASGSLAAAGVASDTSANATSATDTGSLTAATADNAVIVREQTAGQSVSVAQVDLKVGGWVAIQDDVNGKPGSVLGAAYFSSGQTLGGSVSLLRPTIAGNSYFAVLRFDNGVNYHTFNPRIDAIIYDYFGHPVATEFNAQ